MSGQRDDRDPPARMPCMFMAPLLRITSGSVGVPLHLQKKRTQEDVRPERPGCAAGEAAAGV